MRRYFKENRKAFPLEISVVFSTKTYRLQILLLFVSSSFKFPQTSLSIFPHPPLHLVLFSQTQVLQTIPEGCGGTKRSSFARFSPRGSFSRTEMAHMLPCLEAQRILRVKSPSLRRHQTAVLTWTTCQFSALDV